jgi:hypothetical protein
MIATVMPVGLSALNVFEGVVRVCIASGDAQISPASRPFPASI